MSRAFKVGIVAIGALLLGSIVAISVLMSDAPDAASDLAASPGAPATPAPSAQVAAIGSSAPPWQPPVPPDTDAPKHRAADNALPPETHKARISFRGQMQAGIAGIQKRLARCSPNAAVRLDLETVANGIRVVDVFEEPEVTTEPDLACARDALKGQVIPAQDAEPGRRWQMPLVVRR